MPSENSVFAIAVAKASCSDDGFPPGEARQSLKSQSRSDSACRL